MNKVKIYHINYKEIEKLNKLEYTFQPSEEMAKELYKNELFSHIATLELEEDNIGKILNLSYQLTNHIDDDWTKNKEVIQLNTKQARSSSVGDIFEYNDKYYIVNNIGFIEANIFKKDKKYGI